MNEKIISIWGDSIGKGVLFSSERNRYMICRDSYERALKTLGLEVKNYSKMGCTSVEGEDLMTDDRLMTGKGGIAVIEFGGNDSDIDWRAVDADPEKELHPAKVSIPEFKRAVTAMAKKARSFGLTPIMVSPLPVLADRYLTWAGRGLRMENLLRYVGSADYIYRWQERYDIALREAAAEVGVGIFDLRSIFLGEKNLPDMMCIDGIHPNENGHELIARSALEFVSGRI